MTSFGVAVRSLPLALASVKQAAISDSRLYPKWRAIAVVTLLTLALMLYLQRTVWGRDAPTRIYDHNSVRNWQMHSKGESNRQRAQDQQEREKPYNDTYPLSPTQKTGQGTRYRIGVIADLDEASRSSKDQTWFSYMKRGYLTVSDSNDRLEVDWDADMVLFESHLAENGRGIGIQTHTSDVLFHVVVVTSINESKFD